MIDRMSRITGPEFAAHRSRLGLTMAELGKRLGVRADTIKRWESEREPVPYRVPDELAELHRQQDALAQQMAGADGVVFLRRGDGWSLAAACRAQEMEPDIMLEWLPVSPCVP